MRRSTFCLLVVLFGSWLSSFGQNPPKLTSPKIVATFERLGQTAEIPVTNIYTPPKWGTFRISIVMVLTKANGDQSGVWGGEFQFTNAAGVFNISTELSSGNHGTSPIDSPFRAKAGVPMTFSTVSNGYTSGSKYNVWVVVEQLM
jgi:hypothetical protein